MSNNPLTNQNYINKDFQTIYPELLDLVKKLTYKWDPTISNESDPGVLLIKLNAIIADKNNYNIDKNILECFPDTVTQYDNAYKLYEQLGYNMHWYKSATGEVSFNWKSDTYKADNGDVISVKIPQFTMISDRDKEIVYTTLESASVPTDGKTITVNAIQGVVRDFTVGGSSLIRPTMLDYRNRLYFPVSNVAQNGIFISDANKDEKGYYQFIWDNPNIGLNTGWSPVDNLYIQPLHKKCYKFGIDKSNNSCYIEFPSDITDLMGEGVQIKYIQSDGALGNIASKRISMFYRDISESVESGNISSQTINVSTNTSVTNFGSITNGLEPETMDSAYTNYQRTVGTFDTLVTLRDYLNYIVNTEFEQVSNGVVTDRLNDIQSAYEIVTSQGDNTFNRPVVSTTLQGGVEIPQMTAFDLKTYFLEYSQWPKFTSDTAVEDQKVRFKAAYDKSFRFKLSPTDDELETSEVIKMLYTNAKSISHDFISKLSARPLLIKNKFNLNLTIIPNNILSQAQADDIEKNIYESLLKQLSSQNIKFGEELTYERVYDICNHSDNRVKAVALDNIEYIPYVVVYLGTDYENYVAYDVDGNIITLKKGLNEIPLLTVDRLLTEFEDEDGKINLTKSISLEIITKNILSGSTPLFIPDDSFTYTLDQQDRNRINNIEKITTKTEIEFNTNYGNPEDFTYMEYGDASPSPEHSKMLDDETLFLYSPSLTTLITYSTSTKYIYITDNYYQGGDVDYIPSNRDYRLSTGQHLFIFWKEEDQEESPYLYAKYGEGTILKSTMRLVKYKNERNKNLYDQISTKLLDSGYGGEGQILGVLNNDIKSIEDTILGSNKEIAIKSTNSVKLEDPHNYCYWITNNKVTRNDEEYNQIKFDYVTLPEVTIDRSFQGGLVYVSNFEWNDSKPVGNSKDNINDTLTLDWGMRIYILKPITYTIRYSQLNKEGDGTVETFKTVTDYVHIHTLKYGDTIKCTWNINYNEFIFYGDDSENGYDGVEDILSTASTDEQKVIPWGSIENHTKDGFSYNTIITNKLADLLNDFSGGKLVGGYKIDVVKTTDYPSFGTEDGDDGISTFEYHLKPNEMFVYTDDSKKSLYILEHGTTISLDVPNKSITEWEEIPMDESPSTTIPIPKPITIEVPSMDRDSITQNGEKAFKDDMWYDFDSNSGKIIGITENQILTMGPGTEIRVRKNPIEISISGEDENGNPTTSIISKYDEQFNMLKITSDGVYVGEDYNHYKLARKGSLSKYTIQYRPPGETSYSEVPNVEHYDLGWDGYTILNIHAGPNSPQTLNVVHNQQFEVWEKDVEQPISICPPPMEEGINSQLYLQTSSYLNLTGGKDIDTTSINSYNEIDYPDMIYYTLSNITNSQVKKYGETYEITLNNKVTADDGNPSTRLTNTTTIDTTILENTILVIEFDDDVSKMDSFIVESKVYDNINGIEYTKTLTPLGFDNGIVVNNVIHSGTYYYDITEEISNISFTFVAKDVLYDEDDKNTHCNVSFRLKPLFVYDTVTYVNDKNRDKYGEIKELLLNSVNNWNVDNQFNFTYRPNYDYRIDDPLKPSSYFEKSHKYNGFVIPQISNINIKTMNKRN